ncbi:MAG: hypothetical protein AB8I08_10560 [Sandaracinaceae bacterium]
MSSPLLGVCAPVLGEHYGHDLAVNPRFPTWPCSFDAMGAARPMALARRLGFGAVRLFLCEGGEGLRLDDEGRVIGVQRRLLESLEILQEAARLHGLYLYPSLLDAGSIEATQDPLTAQILKDPDATSRFAEHVVRPLAAALDPGRTVGLDVLRCPEKVAGDVGWPAIGRAVKTMGDAARDGARLLVTSGTTIDSLGDLLGASPAVDAVDLELDEDALPPTRASLADRLGDAWIRTAPLIVGSAPVSGPAPMTALLTAMHDTDVAAAFVWRLSALTDGDGPNAIGSLVAQAG